MTLKIEKVSDGRKTVIRLSGRLQSEHLDEFKTQIKNEHSVIALDLESVTLVDVEVIRFLNGCEDGGVELLHCSPYIRDGCSVSKIGKNKANRFSIIEIAAHT